MISVESILKDKAIKAKDKTVQFSQLLLQGKLLSNELIQAAKSQNDADRATIIEALEFATKTKPGILTDKDFDFVVNSLADPAPRVKWESAKVIGNCVQTFPTKLKKAIPSLLENSEHKGTVVRWSAAYALSAIIQCKTSLNKELVPAVEAIIKREEQNSIKKIYLRALKKVSV